MEKVFTLGELKKQTPGLPGVREEMRSNLVARLREGRPVFQDLKGYENSVVPQMVNAILCGHNIIILGERGQGKSRIIRDLIGFLDAEMPAVEGCPIHDNPFRPVCADCKARLAAEGDALPLTWIPREKRLVEKLATSDVSTADLIGEVDPIRIAGGKTLDDETAIHFGLVPRANRGIFAVNELPDLAEKIQVALFNVMEERDLQIKGFPVRLPLDILVVASANPEDYTSRGRIITPLKDRFDSQVKTHYPKDREVEIAIMEQEARRLPSDAMPEAVPRYIREIIAEMTIQARTSPDISQHSGVSCRATIRTYEAILGSAFYRCIELGESRRVPRITDLELAFPAFAGKLELEYGGQDRKEGDIVDELARRAVKTVFDEHFKPSDLSAVVEAFNSGIGAEVSRSLSSREYLDGLNTVGGLREAVQQLTDPDDPPAAASAIEFILEGLHLSNRLNRETIEGKTLYTQRAAVQESMTPPEGFSD